MADAGQKPTAFVAGATGYVGREVVRELRARDIDTVAHVRPGSSSLERWRREFSDLGARVDESAWTAEAIEAAMTAHQPTWVFALLGTTRKRAKSERIDGDPYDAIDYGLTAMLHDAVIAAGATPRFVYLSVAGLSGPSRSAYTNARWRAEKLIEAGGLPHVFARPAIITGDDRDESRPGERVAGAVADGVLGVLGALGAKQLRSRYRTTTNVILGKALVRLALESTEKSVIAEGDDLR